MKTKKSIPANKIIFWVLGFMALVWFLLRTGTNPKRLAYPCQQAVFPLASAFLISFMAAITGIILFRKVISKSILLILIAFVAIFNISSIKLETTAAVVKTLPVWTVVNPISKIFVMDTVYTTGGSLAAGNSTVPDPNLDDPTMDTLFKICSGNGLHLYKNTEHPDGVVGKNDIVIIKGNFQFKYRLVTNTDRIKGLIRLILAHPDGFKGEILVCDNTQDVGSILKDDKNNSEDLAQSILDVVNTFKSKGFPVSIYEWKIIRSIPVKEYSSNDSRDGYVFQQDKVTYPKFKTPGNAFISLRYGIWNPDSSTYDLSRLTIINFPVLKAHGMAGATIGIKNWVGVSTIAFTDSLYGNYQDMHYKYFWGEYALVARIMAVIPPKLTIVDASYTAITSNATQPPNNTIVQTNKMLVSRDPVAVSWYAAKYILTPIATYPLRTNPDNLSGDPGRNYGLVLRKWTKFLIDSAHMAYTLDSSRISVYNSIPRLAVQMHSLSFDIEASFAKISVTSNVSWEAESNAIAWLSVIPAAGSNNGEIVISATLNTGIERKGNIIVTGSGITRTIEVTQKAAPVLTVNQAFVNMDNPASDIRVAVTSNVSWEAESNAVSWLSVIPAAGSNNGEIVISATLNTGIERKGNIIVTGSGITRTIEVTQKAAPVLTVNQAFVYVGNPASDIRVAVTSNVSWEAESNAGTWLSVTPAAGSNNGEIVISATLNTSIERKGNISITGSGITRTIEVTQKAAPVLDITPSILYFEAGEGIIPCTIASNVLWNISSEAKWLVVDPTTGSNNGNINISVSANLTSVERKAIIIVAASNVDAQTLTLTQAGTNTTDLYENQLVRIVGPNPVSDKLYVQLSPEDIPSSIGIYSLKGEQLILIQTATTKAEIDMSHLESGIYILKIRSPKQMIEEKIFKK